MANAATYGDTVLLRSLSDSSSSTKLSRISLEKGSEGANYDEAWLQTLIMLHPGLLPVSQVEPVFEGMVPVCREVPLRGGFIDNVFVTPNGDVALVECKLWRNPEARRKVIAQIIDYASELSTLTYEGFEAVVLRGQLTTHSESRETRSLFHEVFGGENHDEAAFHDAVTRNLRRGRFLLIIIGDGIREGLESMAAFLQQHAGLHFTLCLVELALFSLPDGSVIAQPRILGKTVNIERGIVVLNDSRLEVRTSSVQPANEPLSSSISSESFYESLDAALPGAQARLQALLIALEPFGIKADIKAKTLTLRWINDFGSWNLGTIVNDGALWMDYHAQQARNLNLTEESRTYLKTLASITPTAHVALMKAGDGWNLRKLGQGSLSAAEFLTDKGRDTWIEAISAFQRAVLAKSQE